jgi:rubrerythrin
MATGEIKKLEEMIEVVVRSIPKESQAHELFLATARESRSEMVRLLFSSLAEQEEEHEAKLRAALEVLQLELNEARGKLGPVVEEKIQLHEEEIPLEQKIRDLERVLEVVLRMIPKERAAHDLYLRTSLGTKRELPRKLFELLALQEEQHEAKLRAVLDLFKHELNKIQGKA